MRKVLVYASIVCGLVAASPASAAEIVRAGPGCTDKDLASRAFTARDVHHDIAMFGKLVDEGIANGFCRLFLIGNRVTIDESSLLDLTCVRADSDHECFWVLPSMVSR